MERLISDLYVDRENIESIIKIQEAKKENVEQLMKVIEEKPAIDTLLSTILEGNPTFYPVVGNYQSALATGKLEIIKDNNLLNLIIGLYDSYSRLQYNSRNSDDQWFIIRNKYKRVLRTNYLDLDQIESKGLLDDLHLYREGLEFYISRCRETLSEIQNLISDLE